MPLTSELPSLPLVWPSNCGFGTLTLTHRAQPLAAVVALKLLALLEECPPRA